MDGSPSSVISLGFGNGTFAPVVGLVLTLGLGISAIAAGTPPITDFAGNVTRITDLAGAATWITDLAGKITYLTDFEADIE